MAPKFSTRAVAAKVTDLTFSSDGSLVAGALANGTVEVWDAVTTLPVGVPLVGHTGPVTRVAFAGARTHSSARATTRLRSGI